MQALARYGCAAARGRHDLGLESGGPVFKRLPRAAVDRTEFAAAAHGQRDHHVEEVQAQAADERCLPGRDLVPRHIAWHVRALVGQVHLVGFLGHRRLCGVQVRRNVPERQHHRVRGEFLGGALRARVRVGVVHGLRGQQIAGVGARQAADLGAHEADLDDQFQVAQGRGDRLKDVAQVAPVQGTRRVGPAFQFREFLCLDRAQERAVAAGGPPLLKAQSGLVRVRALGGDGRENRWRVHQEKPRLRRGPDTSGAGFELVKDQDPDHPATAFGLPQRGQKPLQYRGATRPGTDDGDCVRFWTGILLLTHGFQPSPPRASGSPGHTRQDRPA